MINILAGIFCSVLGLKMLKDGSLSGFICIFLGLINFVAFYLL